MLFQKVWKLLLWIGLIGLIAIIAIRKSNPLMKLRAIMLFNKYRELLPYIEAQAKHETGNFNSSVYRNDHNLFGMKWTNGRRGQIAQRGTIAPENDGTYYAKYSSDSSSIVDLLKWFEVKKFPVRVANVEQYVSELKDRNYFGDKEENYLKGLKRFL